MRTYKRYTRFWSPIWTDPDTGELNFLAVCELH